MINSNQKSLWKNYYSALKPYCSGCLKKGISKEEYAFCSTEKAEPFLIYEENAWGKKGKFKGTLDNIYICNVYHWTIYQTN